MASDADDPARRRVGRRSWPSRPTPKPARREGGQAEPRRVATARAGARWRGGARGPAPPACRRRSWRRSCRRPPAARARRSGTPCSPPPRTPPARPADRRRRDEVARPRRRARAARAARQPRPSAVTQRIAPARSSRPANGARVARARPAPAARAAAATSAARGRPRSARRSPGRSSEQPPGAREVHGERRGGAHGGVERLLARRPARVQHHQRARVGVGDQPPLHHLAAAGDGRPVDARRGRALAVGAQRVELELGALDGERRPVGLDAGAAAGRARPPASSGSIRGSTSTSAGSRGDRRARPGRAGRAIASRVGSSQRRPRRAKRTSIRTRRGAPGRARAAGGRAAARPARRRAAGSRPRLDVRRTGSGCSSSTVRASRRAVDGRAPCAASPPRRPTPAPSSSERDAGHVQRRRVERGGR